MPHFRKRPVVIEAHQWDGSAAQAGVVLEWVHSHGGTATYHCTRLVGGECTGEPDDHVIRIATLEGDMDARPGWWVIRGIKGEFYPCAPDIFEATYEQVEEGD